MGYSDVNWVEGTAAKSTIGTLFMLNGGSIYWYSKRQPIMALSICEAEYMAAAVATQDAIWLGPYLAEIRGKERRAVPIGVDNQGAIALAKKDGWNRRIRHMNVRFMFVQEALQSREIKMPYV
jgi:hypothetical protein